MKRNRRHPGRMGQIALYLLYVVWRGSYRHDDHFKKNNQAANALVQNSWARIWCSLVPLGFDISLLGSILKSLHKAWKKKKKPLSFDLDFTPRLLVIHETIFPIRLLTTARLLTCKGWSPLCFVMCYLRRCFQSVWNTQPGHPGNPY